MKVDKSFESLTKKMDALEETELGKLKGGISVIGGKGSGLGLDNNSGTCVNHGSCDGETNDGLCFNNKSLCPTTK